jgi:hypothetical protein
LCLWKHKPIHKQSRSRQALSASLRRRESTYCPSCRRPRIVRYLGEPCCIPRIKMITERGKGLVRVLLTGLWTGISIGLHIGQKSNITTSDERHGNKNHYHSPTALNTSHVCLHIVGSYLDRELDEKHLQNRRNRSRRVADDTCSTCG